MATQINDGQFTLIAPATGAVTSKPYTSKVYQVVTVSADALAGAETVNILAKVGSTLVQVLMPDLTTPARLNNLLTGLPLIGGPTYVFVKSSTASACGVYIDAQLQ